MAELTSDQRLEIVRALACFTTPTEVSKAMKEQYGLDVPVQQVVKYDPTKAAFEGAAEYRTLFEEMRKGYLEQVSAVPIANQGYRLQVLQKGLDASLASKNFVLAANLLEQAAKEVGGVLTNERNLKVDDQRDRGYKDLTAEERRDMFTEMVVSAIGNKRPVIIDQTEKEETP